ncbi:MAG TPA: inositol monophosphatase family protein [Acidobacteriota bacterium]|nr:inositol monophosphatase family protein [Acidobacteriota bacterium]
MSGMREFEQLAVEIAREAGALLRDRFGTDFEVSHKGEVNLVTEVDLAAEALIVSRIRAAFPDHIILAEENYSERRSGSHIWIIDPLDGTTNYAHGFPVFAVSIGLEIDGELACGIVYNPMQDEMFTARRGAGAYCNEKTIRVSSTAALDKSLLSTGFPYDIRTNTNNNLDNFREFALRAQGVRRAGAAALDFCSVAAGRFDGFWELSLHPWDCAAGYLLVREAGGRVTDFRGREGSIYEPEMIASNGLIHEEMVAVLRHTASLTSLS